MSGGDLDEEKDVFIQYKHAKNFDFGVLSHGILTNGLMLKQSPQLTSLDCRIISLHPGIHFLDLYPY